MEKAVNAYILCNSEDSSVSPSNPRWSELRCCGLYCFLVFAPRCVSWQEMVRSTLIGVTDEVVVNDIAASAGGALTVLEGFYRYVRDVDEDNEWVFLLGSDLVEESERIRTVVLPEVKGSWIRRLAFDLVSGRRLVRSLKPDVLFSLQNTYTYGVGCPQVVYVHQSLPFQQAMSFSFLRRDGKPGCLPAPHRSDHQSDPSRRPCHRANPMDERSHPRPSRRSQRSGPLFRRISTT